MPSSAFVLLTGALTHFEAQALTLMTPGPTLTRML